MDFAGIDVGKTELHVVLLQGENAARKSISNNRAGFEQLSKWLKNRKASDVHFCLESTGPYGIAIAEHLYDEGFKVSVVNPRQTKAFGQSELVRTKTDLVDAGIIARFCRATQPRLWEPPALHVRELRALIRRRETLTDMLTAEKNRLETSTTTEVRRSIKTVINNLETELRKLEDDIDKHIDGHPDLREKIDRLDEIPGFGSLTAIKVFVETNGFEVCKTAKQLVAFAGLNPREYRSGKTVRRCGISKIGNSALRKALYYAALSAKNHSPYFRPFAQRLAAAGKRPKVIITAIMRKLLVLAFAIAKTQSHFDPAFAA